MMAKKNKTTMNVNDMSTWTFPVVMIVSLVIIVGIAFLIKTFLADPVTESIASVDSEIKKKETKYAKDQETVALLPHIRKEVAELEIIRDEAKKYLPTEVSMPSLIDNVYLAARNNGIVFKKFAPEADIDTKYYTIKPISLSANVGYLSMSSFIEEVTSLKRIMNVESVQFLTLKTNEDEGYRSADDPLEMTAQLRTYVFKNKDGSKANKK